jgi:hypothetical protein
LMKNARVYLYDSKSLFQQHRRRYAGRIWPIDSGDVPQPSSAKMFGHCHIGKVATASKPDLGSSQKSRLTKYLYCVDMDKIDVLIMQYII